MPYLILVRHGKSAWNQLGLWTGHTEVDLTEEGREEARKAAEAIRDIPLHKAHVSDMNRAHQTLHEMKKTLGRQDLEHKSHHALKERGYGVYTGKNKWQVKEEIGEEKFQEIRRGWDVPIPEGESLKDVHARVSAYYDEHIKPDLQNGHNTVVVAHGNSLRALAKHVEGLTEQQVCELEIGTGEIHCYQLDAEGKVVGKEIRSANEQKGKV